MSPGRTKVIEDFRKARRLDQSFLDREIRTDKEKYRFGLSPALRRLHLTALQNGTNGTQPEQ